MTLIPWQAWNNVAADYYVAIKISREEKLAIDKTNAAEIGVTYKGRGEKPESQPPRTFNTELF